MSWCCFLGRRSSMKRIAIYLRVSTDKQTTNNQRRELEAVAERSGWEVVKVYQDAGISGVKLGRSRVKPSVEAQILALRDRGHGILRIGRQLGIGTSVVQRVFRETPWKRQSA